MVYNFSDRETITLALINAIPHVKDWWDTYCEQASIEESEMFGTDPLGHLLWTLLRGSITLSETMKTSTRDGPHCGRKGTKQCKSSPISSTPCAQSLVLETPSDIWF